MMNNDRISNAGNAKVVVDLKNLADGTRKQAVIANSHHTVVTALATFARRERVPICAIDIKVSPLGELPATA